MRTGRALVVLLILLTVACGGGGGGPAPDPNPDPDPAPDPRGQLVPGSEDALHATVREASFGSGDLQYWLFTPADPAPASAPVVVFLHGWSVLDPGPYRAFIDHIVRRGNTVVYPRYQTSIFSLPSTFTGNMIAAVTDAFDRLEFDGPVAPETERVAALGHSFGGVLAANLAALADGSGLPPIRALLCMEPGTGGFAVHADYSRIPTGTLLLSVAGEEDLVVGRTDAIRIFSEATAVSFDDKDYVLLRSDRNQSPPLVADHSAPVAASDATADAFDRQGFWKWFDGLASAAFYGTFREFALGGTPEQADLGSWPDGTRILRPDVTDAP